MTFTAMFEVVASLMLLALVADRRQETHCTVTCWSNGIVMNIVTVKGPFPACTGSQY